MQTYMQIDLLEAGEGWGALARELILILAQLLMIELFNLVRKSVEIAELIPK